MVFLDGQNVNEIIQNNFADKRPSPAMSPVQQVQQLQQDVGGGGHYSTGRPSQLPQRNWNAPSPSGSNDSTAALVAQLQNEKANLIQKVHEMKMDMQVLGVKISSLLFCLLNSDSKMAAENCCSYNRDMCL